METIERLTRAINVFVRFFESINCLFWQLDWLRQNILQRDVRLLAAVAVIVCLCGVLILPGDDLEAVGAYIDSLFSLPAYTAARCIRLLPLVIVLSILAALVCRRVDNSIKYGQVNQDDPEAAVTARDVPPPSSLFLRR
jgi:hypothetical protein